MQELESVEREIAGVKQQLLHSLLHQERVLLLQRSLQTERTGQEPDPAVKKWSEKSIASPGNGGEERYMEDVAGELATVEKAIQEGKQQLLKVMKRMEVSQMEQDEEEEEKEK